MKKKFASALALLNPPVSIAHRKQPLDEESETNGVLNKLIEDRANPEPPMGLQFASISVDPNGNIITWNTSILDPSDVRAPESIIRLSFRYEGRDYEIGISATDLK